MLSAPMKERHDAAPPARLDRDPTRRPAAGGAPALVGLQQAIGNRAFGRALNGDRRVRSAAPALRLLSRQPAPRDAKHPENFATYEEWLGALGVLAKTHFFVSNDEAPKGGPAS